MASHNPEIFADAGEVAELLGLPGREALYKSTRTRTVLDALGMPQPLPYRKRSQLWLRKAVLTFRDVTLATGEQPAAPANIPRLVVNNDPWASRVRERVKEALS